MIFTSCHLDFYRIRHMGMTQYFPSGFIRFFYHENIGVDTKNMILCHVEIQILLKLDFHGGDLKNGLNQYLARYSS